MRSPAAALSIGLVLLPTAAAQAQAPNREQILAAARSIMAAAGFCTLVTLDSEGRPRARIMDPFEAEPDFTIWMATNRETRKVDQIRRDPRATLIYFEPDGVSYVTLVGVAHLIEEPDEKARRWKERWAGFYDDANAGEDYLLIRFVPESLEMVSLEHQIASDPRAWKPAVVDLTDQRP